MNSTEDITETGGYRRMSDLTKLVLVRHTDGGKAYLFQANAEASIQEGDMVICKTRKGDIAYGIAVAITTVTVCSDYYRFICTGCDAIEPLSEIIGKYQKINF